MKNLGKLLKPKHLLIGAILLSSCEIQNDYDINLDGLEPWQKKGFIEAGRSWGIPARENKYSENKAYIGEIPDTVVKNSIAVYSQIINHTLKEALLLYKTDWTRYEIVFKEGINWVDCSIEGEKGTNFYKVAKHEWGHVRGEEDGKEDPDDIMYFEIKGRCD